MFGVDFGVCGREGLTAVPEPVRYVHGFPAVLARLLHFERRMLHPDGPFSRAAAATSTSASSKAPASMLSRGVLQSRMKEREELRDQLLTEMATGTTLRRVAATLFKSELFSKALFRGYNQPGVKPGQLDPKLRHQQRIAFLCGLFGWLPVGQAQFDARGQLSEYPAGSDSIAWAESVELLYNYDKLCCFDLLVDVTAGSTGPRTFARESRVADNLRKYGLLNSTLDTRSAYWNNACSVSFNQDQLLEVLQDESVQAHKTIEPVPWFDHVLPHLLVRGRRAVTFIEYMPNQSEWQLSTAPPHTRCMTLDSGHRDADLHGSTSMHLSESSTQSWNTTHSVSQSTNTANSQAASAATSEGTTEQQGRVDSEGSSEGKSNATTHSTSNTDGSSTNKSAGNSNFNTHGSSDSSSSSLTVSATFSVSGVFAPASASISATSSDTHTSHRSTSTSTNSSTGSGTNKSKSTNDGRTDSSNSSNTKGLSKSMTTGVSKNLTTAKVLTELQSAGRVDAENNGSSFSKTVSESRTETVSAVAKLGAPVKVTVIDQSEVAQSTWEGRVELFEDDAATKPLKGYVPIRVRGTYERKMSKSQSMLLPMRDDLRILQTATGEFLRYDPVKGFSFDSKISSSCVFILHDHILHLPKGAKKVPGPDYQLLHSLQWLADHDDGLMTLEIKEESLEDDVDGDKEGQSQKEELGDAQEEKKEVKSSDHVPEHIHGSSGSRSSIKWRRVACAHSISPLPRDLHQLEAHQAVQLFSMRLLKGNDGESSWCVIDNKIGERLTQVYKDPPNAAYQRDVISDTCLGGADTGSFYLVETVKGNDSSNTWHIQSADGRMERCLPETNGVVLRAFDRQKPYETQLNQLFRIISM